jgi:hypothetical protein
MGKDDKTPVSARIKIETKEFLELEAKKNKISLALLLANAIEDYALWLRSPDSKSRRDR